MKFATLERRQVAIWGLGREGRAAREALRRHLPGQPLTVFCSEAEAASAIAEAAITLRTHAPDAAELSTFDFVIKSPGIPIYKPEITAARACGTVFTSGTALWFGEHPAARVIAITGTKGKSTTAAMTAHLARAAGLRTALAGNIGLPLLDLDGRAADLWVIELSSFQTGEAGPLEVGVVTSLHEEHLDWHGSRERYFADKLKLADVSRTLVVNATQPELVQRTAGHPRRVFFGDATGWHLEHVPGAGAEVITRRGCDGFALARLPTLGRHNALNACAALSALDVAGIGDGDPAAPLASFRPLPDRLQHLGRHDGFDWVNDSIATTPQATLAALASLAPQRVSVLVGGYDRGLDWSGFARDLAVRPDVTVIAQGANRARIAAAMRGAAPSVPLHRAIDLEQAVALAREVSRAGDVILLSPGAPSFDQFHDYTRRGACFARLAGCSPRSMRGIEGLGIA